MVRLEVIWSLDPEKEQEKCVGDLNFTDVNLLNFNWERWMRALFEMDDDEYLKIISVKIV